MSVEQQGAHEGGGRAPYLVAPLMLHRHTPSSYIYLRTPNRPEGEPKT